MRQDNPEEVMAFGAEVMQDHLDLLGESPEAWRGAAIVTEAFREFLKAPFTALPEITDDVEDMDPMRYGALLLMTTLLTGAVDAILGHPCVQALPPERGHA